MQRSEGNEGGQRNQHYAAHSKKLHTTLFMNRKKQSTNSPCNDLMSNSVSMLWLFNNKQQENISKPQQSIGGNSSSGGDIWMVNDGEQSIHSNQNSKRKMKQPSSGNGIF